MTAIQAPSTNDEDASSRGHLREADALIRRGVLVMLVGLVPVGLWSATAPLASAVVAPAVVKVDLNRRPVQHAEGGTVREVRVRDGQRVAQGETLIVLGDVGIEADLQRWVARIHAEQAERARLEAEQAMAASLTFPTELQVSAQADNGLAQLLERQRSLFNMHRHALTSQVALLNAQRQKVLREVDSLDAQINRAGESLNLQREEADNQRRLQQEGFIAPARVSQLDAQVADYGVRLQERHSESARAQQKLIEIDLRLRTLENEYRQQAGAELKAVQVRLSEIEQEQRKSTDAVSRQTITAPVAGEVMELKVTAPGAVLSPRDTVAQIVPTQQELVIEAMLRPEDIDRVQRGQSAKIRFPALAPQMTSMIGGTVTYLSADRLVDRQSGTAFYLSHVRVDAIALQQAGNPRIQAGMPAEVFIEGAARTALEYLMEPVRQVLRHAAREQ